MGCDLFSPAALDGVVLMAVIRQRVVADRMSTAHQDGIRQLVVLGAGCDCTAFDLPTWAADWRVFEVDHPATQQWKRGRITDLGWELPANLTLTGCDFERQAILDSLSAAGFRAEKPALVSLLGVIRYLTEAATRATLAEIARFVPGSELIFTYSEPPDGSDPVAQEVFTKSAAMAEGAGELYVGYYTPAQIDALLHDAGFAHVQHRTDKVLHERYFANRVDELRLSKIESLVSATC